jgi:hypothetical protein
VQQNGAGNGDEEDGSSNGVPPGFPPPHILQRIIEDAMTRINSDNPNGDGSNSSESGTTPPAIAEMLGETLNSEEGKKLLENMSEEGKKMLENMGKQVR